MLRHISTFFVLLSVILFATSCNITTSVHFNRDYSGNYTMDVDLSDVLSMGMMADSSDSEDPMAEIRAGMLADSSDSEDPMAEIRAGMDEMDVIATLEQTAGVHDVSIEMTDDGKMAWRFSFDNMEALNNAFKTLNSDLMSGDALGMGLGMGGGTDAIVDPSAIPAFTRKGKLITHRSEYSNDEMGELMGGEEDGEGMFDMSALIDYTIEFTFDRKIKDVELHGLDLLKQESHLVRTRLDLKSAMELKYYEISVKLK